jgi:phosphate-selective porin OprO/OprP
MKRILITLSLISLTLVLSNNTYAQGCDAPSSDEGVQVFGYIQPELRTFFYEEPEVSFAFRRARIGVMGNIPYDFSYYVLLETSQFMNPEDRTGAFLLDAYVSYTRFEYFKVSLGQFKYRLGNELSQPCNGLYTINRSKSVDVLTGGIGGGNRDVGMMILGGSKSTFLQYYASITNSLGVFATENNLVDNVALTGRVVVQPIKGLYLGGSYRWSKNPPEDATVLDYDTKTRYGFDAEYHVKNFTIFGEYINGGDKGSTTDGGGCGGGAPTLVPGDQISNGYYGMIIYRWKNFEPVYKFEGFERTKSQNDVVTGEPEMDMWHTAGLNYYPNDWVRLQLNYIYKTEDPDEIKNDCLLFQVQVKF